MLRIDLPQDHLIFSPTDTIRMEIRAAFLAGSSRYISPTRARLVTTGGATELGSQEQSIKSTSEDSIPASVHCEFKVPPNDGVYEVIVEATEPAALRWAKPKLVVERRVQFAVVKDHPPIPSVDAAATWTPVMEIDPANPRWYERFVASSFLPNLGQGNFGNVTLQPWQQALGSAVQLSPERQ